MASAPLDIIQPVQIQSVTFQLTPSYACMQSTETTVPPMPCVVHSEKSGKASWVGLQHGVATATTSTTTAFTLPTPHIHHRRYH